ncbi:ABC transporter substrate-binding protein [Dactylosporangium fulvum]
MRTRIRSLLVVGLAVAFVAACSSGGGSTTGDTTTTPFDRNATLRFGFSVSPTTWDPHKLAQDYNNLAIFPVYDRILDTDPDGKVIAGLAEKWEFSSDGLTLTLTMRDGAKFHDGSAVDAASVKANLDAEISGQGMLAAPLLKVISDVTVSDPKTVKLTLKSQAAYLPSVLANRAGALVCPSMLTAASLETQPCGAGPFKVTLSRQNDRIVYERFEDYWNVKDVQIKTLEMTIQPAEATRLSSFQSGQLDATYMNAATIDSAKRAGVAVDPQTTFTWYGIFVNWSKGDLGNPAVRQAINLAIDRKSIIDRLSFGYASDYQQPFPPNYFANNKDLKSPYWTYDPNKAKELLAGAGLTDKVSFTCELANSNAFPDIAAAVQQQLAAVGIKMNYTTATTQAVTQNYFIEGKTDCTFGAYSGVTDPSLALQQLFAPDGSLNGSHTWLKPEFQTMYEATLRPGDQRDAAIHTMVKSVMEEAAVIPLFYPQRSYIAKPKVKGLEKFPVDTTTRFINLGLAQ